MLVGLRNTMRLKNKELLFMKKILLGLMVCGVLTSCGIFKHKTTDQTCPANVNSTDEGSTKRSSCPPAAFGAEKLLSYADREEAHSHPTEKGDPITGKKTSVKKGIRTGELDKPVKLTRAERKQKRSDERKKKAEDLLLEKQIERDAKLAKKEPDPY